MKRYAAFFAYRMARPGTDKKALAEDLDQEGWENLYKQYESPIPWQRIATAMKNRACLWECGVTFHGYRTYDSRELRLPIAYEDWAAEAIDGAQSIERQALLQETVAHFFSAIEDRHSLKLKNALSVLWLENGQRVAPDTLEDFDIPSSTALAKHRQVLRRLAQQAIEAAAPADLNLIY